MFIVPPRPGRVKQPPVNHPRIELAIFLSAVGTGLYPLLNFFTEKSLTVVDQILFGISAILFIVLGVIALVGDGSDGQPPPVNH